MPLTATIIFKGDTSVGQKDEVYTMELPYTEQEWENESLTARNGVRKKIVHIYNELHIEKVSRVVLPGEKY